MKWFIKWKPRQVIKNERDHYKQLLEKERQETARLKQEKADVEFENQDLSADKEKLESENLAKRNIIDEERRKHKKKVESMQKRIDKLEAENEKLKKKAMDDGDEHDLFKKTTR